MNTDGLHGTGPAEGGGQTPTYSPAQPSKHTLQTEGRWTAITTTTQVEAERTHSADSPLHIPAASY